MTSTWLTYAPRDFLMFGPDVYWRLFELHNRALWPLPVLAGVTGLVCLLLLSTRRSLAVRTAVILVAVACLGAAYFCATRYGPINWPANYAAWGFALEAGLLTVTVSASRLTLPEVISRATGIAGYGLLALALVLYPVVGLAFGRSLAQAEIIGLAPDPTAIACLGVLSLVATGGWMRALTVIPLLWCVSSAATLLALGDPQAWVLIAALILWASGPVIALVGRK